MHSYAQDQMRSIRMYITYHYTFLATVTCTWFILRSVFNALTQQCKLLKIDV